MLEKHLHSRTFLVGNSVTLADIVGACNLYWGYTKVSSPLTNDRLSQLLHWCTLEAGSSVILADILGTLKLR